MRAKEVIRAMTMTQAEEIARVIGYLKNGNKEAALDAVSGMDVDTLDLLIAYIEAVQRDRRDTDD